LLGTGASPECGDPDTASINADYVPPPVNELFAQSARIQAMVYDRRFRQFVVDHRELHKFLGVPSPTLVQIEPAQLGAA
jgi:hypothetical protein